MKSAKFIILTVMASLILLASAVAQTGAIRVSIPFDFNVGKQLLPAGEYKISINGSLLEIARLDGRGVAYATTNLTGGGPSDDRAPRLIFHRYANRLEDHRFLAIAWIGEGSQGHELYASPDELEYARNLKQEQQVILALSAKAK